MAWFIILAVIGSLLALGLPPDPHTLQQLNISSMEYRLAILALLIPYGVIWYTAFYAFEKLRLYAHSIKGFDDGKAFQSIMVGMGVLAFGLIVPMITALIMNNIVMHNDAFKPASVIIENYVSLLFELIAFIYINNGTYKLLTLSKNKASLAGMRNFALIIISLSVIFTALVMNYHSQHEVYYLNTPVLIVTFIIPQLFAWFVAILSAYQFRLYAKFANGLLYRKLLSQLSNGIVVAITGAIAIQFVDNTFAAKFKHSLGAILVIDYILLAIIAWGLILMALGAKKLKKIEDA
ncbi:MAG TPA: hypothetical protein VLG47_07310 [Candidatus Saccharimonadales bacterium]|nr:hypothetical protein [Candidatus Saccharimonadales bacterium]